MKKRNKTNPKLFWVGTFLLLMFSSAWVLTREKPIEIRGLEWSNKASYSVVEFEIANNTPLRKDARILISAEMFWNGTDGVGSRRINSEEIELGLSGRETKSMTRVLNYEEGVRFHRSRIVVEVYDITAKRVSNNWINRILALNFVGLEFTPDRIGWAMRSGATAFALRATARQEVQPYLGRITVAGLLDTL